MLTPALDIMRLIFILAAFTAAACAVLQLLCHAFGRS